MGGFRDLLAFLLHWWSSPVVTVTPPITEVALNFVHLRNGALNLADVRSATLNLAHVRETTLDF